ncbi:MAG: hypothetical protein PWP31_69 [Clostridia bacterium]|nr:hypothetical protein [Clostridia bacterium]
MVKKKGYNLSFNLDWRHSGSVLPIVLMVIVVLSLLGTGIISLAMGERRVAANEVKIAQATYLAEAGINLALAELRENPGQQINIGETFLPQAKGKIVSVELTPQVATYHLRSLAEVDRIKRAVEVELSRPFTDYALVTDGDLVIKNTVTVNGDIFATGDVELRNWKDPYTNVVAGGDLTIHHHKIDINGSVITWGNLYNYGTIKGDAIVGHYQNKWGNDPNIYGTIHGQVIKGINYPFPVLPNLVEPYTNSYSLQIEPGEYTLTELQEKMDGITDEIKILYCNGNLTIKDEDNNGHNNNGHNNNGHNGKGNTSDTFNYQGKAIIAATGDIDIENDIRAATEEDAWAFVAGGDLSIDGNVTVDALLLNNGYFYKQGGPSTINGCLITGGITEVEENGDNDDSSNKLKHEKGKSFIKGQLDINYKTDLIEELYSKFNETGLQILSWDHASIY